MRISCACQECDARYDDYRADYIHYRDAFSEEQCRNEHGKDEGCSLEHIRCTEFHPPQHLLPQHGIRPDDTYSPDEPQQVRPGQGFAHRRHLRADSHTGVEQVDAYQHDYVSSSKHYFAMRRKRAGLPAQISPSPMLCFSTAPMPSVA